MKELKKIDPLSLARILGVLFAILGFVQAALTLLIYSASPAQAAAIMPLVSVVGPLILIANPIIYGLVGVLYGLVCALLYNFVANKIGGIKLDLK